MHRQSGSLVMIVMAILTLGIIMLLPMLSENRTETRSATSPPVPASESALALGRSMMVTVEGGLFTQGTTADEINQAVQLCMQMGGDCNPALGLDSMPTHEVMISDFWMEATEVTHAQYVNFLNTLGARGHLTGCSDTLCADTRLETSASLIAFDGITYNTANPAVDDYPITYVTWYGAQAYCEALGRRLPTEAEWEYAARGTNGTLYPWGDEWSYEAANVRGSVRTGNTIIAEVQPVGGFPIYASRDGVRDLAGNVAEWTADWYDEMAYAQLATRANNPTGPSEGTARVVRGGSWDNHAFFARSVQRSHFTPDTTASDVGFRCVADS